MAKRIHLAHCIGVIVDVQEFFLAQLHNRRRAQVIANTRNFVALLSYFKIPMVVTLEKPLYQKGALPEAIDRGLAAGVARFEKSFFDLTKEGKIRDCLSRLKKKQVIVAGCETDVCVLQSCLGLLDLGYEVFLVEELLFSSAQNVEAAIARMKSEGAVFLTYKSLYYELIEAVAGDKHAEQLLDTFGPFPDDLPDCAVEWPFARKEPISKASTAGAARAAKAGRREN